MAPSPVTEPAETLELEDIQGLVLRGYGGLPEARFLLLELEEGHEEAARAYLRGLWPRLNRASTSPEDSALQIAFTAKGLAALGVPDTTLCTFAREFLEGLDDDVRADTLGDRGDNDPSGWSWGTRDEPIHALLLVYAGKDLLEGVLREEKQRLAGAFRVRHEKETQMLANQKEHFGWRDGISMPTIANVPDDPSRTKEKTAKKEFWTDPLPAGEFVLGYRNDYGAYSESPTAEDGDDPTDQLPALPGDTRKDIGKNGTYLVYREMTQDVPRFWQYLATQSREDGSDAAEKAIALGSKMVGRWPGGAPLATTRTDDGNETNDANTFVYRDDTVGLGCPRGAHIRRASPRDVLALEDRGHTAAMAMVRKHQMIRRGRAFGDPLVTSMKPREIFAAAQEGPEARRGLHFICLVSNINRQFEFVQRAWINSANFDALYKDGDPLLAARRKSGQPNQNDELTVPAEPVRRKYKDLPRFTQLVGGGYFFLPGIKALKFIARQT